MHWSIALLASGAAVIRISPNPQLNSLCQMHWSIVLLASGAAELRSASISPNRASAPPTAMRAYNAAGGGDASGMGPMASSPAAPLGGSGAMGTANGAYSAGAVGVSNSPGGYSSRADGGVGTLSSGFSTAAATQVLLGSQSSADLTAYSVHTWPLNMGRHLCGVEVRSGVGL
eukprot:1159139-Pelagomonas_calceolata.AAC.4